MAPLSSQEGATKVHIRVTIASTANKDAPTIFMRKVVGRGALLTYANANATRFARYRILLITEASSAVTAPKSRRKYTPTAETDSRKARAKLRNGRASRGCF